MSIMQSVSADCPACGTTAESPLVSSLNADRRPDLRQDVLDNRLQLCTCAKCGTEFRIVPQLSYIDFARKQWILAHPVSELPRWQELDGVAQEIFDDTLGSSAPGPSQAVGKGMSPRVVFGWPALREKMVCRELGLDDVEVELFKIAVIQSVPKPPVTDDAELRLVGADGDDLLLSWIVGETGAEITSLKVPRSLYQEIAADSAGWAELRNELAAGTFVDLNRLLAA